MSAPYITDRESDEVYQRRCYGIPESELEKVRRHHAATALRNASQTDTVNGGGLPQGACQCPICKPA